MERREAVTMQHHTVNKYDTLKRKKTEAKQSVILMSTVSTAVPHLLLMKTRMHV